MKFVSLANFASLAVVLLSSPAPSFAQGTVIGTYDSVYDNAYVPLTAVACSDGTYGLMSHYFTLGGLPTFPYIGGVYTVAGWNSPACGKCYDITYNGSTGVKNVTILAVGSAPNGVNLSYKAMSDLTDGLIADVGSVDVIVTEVDRSACQIFW